MSPLLVQKVLFAGIVPAALALLFGGLALFQHKRGHACRRLAAWAAPLAAAVGFGIAFAMLHSERAGRGRWLIVATIAVLIAWPVLLMPWPRRAKTIAIGTTGAAIVLALGAGALMWPTFFPDQSAWMRLVPFAAAALLAAILYPLAVRDAKPLDALGVSTAAALLAPIIIFSGTVYVGELLIGIATASGTLGLMGIIVRRARFAEWRHGIAAGALGIGLVLPMFALVAWSAVADLPPENAWQLALPCAAIALLGVRHIGVLAKRPITGAVLAFLLVAGTAAAGLVWARSQTPTEVYQMPY